MLLRTLSIPIEFVPARSIDEKFTISSLPCSSIGSLKSNLSIAEVGTVTVSDAEKAAIIPISRKKQVPNAIKVPKNAANSVLKNCLIINQIFYHKGSRFLSKKLNFYV